MAGAVVIEKEAFEEGRTNNRRMIMHSVSFIDAGETICAQGDNVDRLCIIFEGSVDVSNGYMVRPCPTMCPFASIAIEYSARHCSG